jgi:hypothetical protein
MLTFQSMHLMFLPLQPNDISEQKSEILGDESNITY